MMDQKINVAELLKDCPSGMELDCAICENVYFDKVDFDSGLIKCFIKNDVYENIYFYRDGTHISAQNAKCVIFPKGKTTWEGFVPPCKFKDGDVIYNQGIKAVAIFNKQTDMNTISHCFLNILGKLMICHYHSKVLSDWRLATEEEKQKLFDAIKANGYKWNAETNNLEKLIEPKFKIGDRVKAKKSYISGTITDIDDDSYKVEYKSGGISFFSIKFQNDLELVPNHKFKVGDKITYRDIVYTIVGIDGDYYSVKSIIGEIGLLPIFSENAYDLIPKKFDISSLKPFESKVLVRDNNRKWIAAFYIHYDKDASLHYCVVGGLWYEQCIPYEGNEHLLNTTDDCDEFYKNW